MKGIPLNSISRKVRKSVALASSWLHYYLDSRNKGETLSDLRNWFLSSIVGKDLLHDGVPWITFPAFRWLESYIDSHMKVFEWGSGGSTIFFARHASRVISIEHDLAWFRAVSARLVVASLDGVQLLHVPPDLCTDYSSPLEEGAMKRYKSTDTRFENELFFRYAGSILEYPDEYFDVVMVDGRARIACLYLSLRKVTDGGAVILDNSDRAHYATALDLFSSPDWTTVHFEGAAPRSIWPCFVRTTVFIKS